MSQSKGYILLHRSLQDCWIWFDDEKFTKGQAWVDLLLLANHKDAKISFKEGLISVQRGQFVTSIKKLSDRWGWAYNTTKRFLSILQSDNMLMCKSDNKKTLITIVNYEKFQLSDDDVDVQADVQINEQVDEQIDDQNANKLMTNNKCRINENKKEIYIAHFEEAWKIYPKKKDKSRAFQCYMARINSGYSETELLTATKNYAAECEKEGRPEKYIKNGSTFFGINEPFVDYLRTQKSTPVSDIFEYEIENYHTHPQVPPFYGFPEEWFEKGQPIKERFVTIKQPQNFSVGVTDETIYSPDELWDKYILRKQGYETAMEGGFDT